MASQAESAKGLFASLFDFNFTSFITLKFLKVIYVLLMGLIFLGGIIAFFSFLLRGTAGGVFAALIIVPIGVLVYLLILRVYLESLALFFRIGENTQAIRQSLGGSGGPGASGFGAYPTPPPTPPSQPPAGGPMPSWAQQPPQAPPQPPAQPTGFSQPPQPPQAPPQQPGFPPPGS